ncbi:MAG: hypothetical protein A2719_01710 [Candidatus Ryanbacteria bacterium RIFCSPHIGHO2_01_FULL_45_22]|uniref:Asp/Glu-ADT subunit C n=2 Tax=Candidatus Ryaniibacteriota TaxID=1817914 RepID=A0A1G2FZR8_9BACT|nr:MAG: hypothetical protein A2719_01710 [Candidatus Ryanbacteria bacterium RIFCSPHIGHO2_01_FULL_45_22]OGZ45342.1 MAG: hypothetical protein A3J54_03800 [Candidatus Ryanbacteria bacterium RIFCSPHIGHO2_02_FULL_45_13b]
MISKQDIQKLSELARIEVRESEVEKLRHDLERVLEYVEQLGRAETGTVEAFTNVTGMTNVATSDDARVVVPADVAGLVDAAPGHDQSFVKVPSVWKKR